MSEATISESEEKLIGKLKSAGLPKDDILAIMLVARKYDIAGDILSWIGCHDEITCENILEYIYTELVETEVEIVDDDEES